MQTITSQRQLAAISLKPLSKALERLLLRYYIRRAEKAMAALLATRKAEAAAYQRFLTDSSDVEIQIGKEIAGMRSQLADLR